MARSVRDLLVRITGDGADLEKELNKAVRNLDAVGRRTERLGRDLSLKFTAPMVAAGLVASKLAVDFDTEMTKITTLVGIADEQVNEWRESLLQLGPAIGRSPQELARALFVITSAGERGAAALDILERSGKAAAAGLGDTAEIARTVTAAMQAYASTGLTAERATDILVATVREGNLEASALAGSLGQVLGIAAQVGVGFEEVGAFVATFTRLGVSAEQAVTGLRGALRIMIRPTDDAKRALAEVGVTTDDLRASVGERGLARTLISLVGAFDGNTEALGRVIPEVEALAAVMGTAGVQAEQFEQIADNVADSVGILDDAFARVELTPAQDLAELRATLEAIAITLGDSLAPSLSEVIRAALPYLRALREVDQETVKATVHTLALAAAFGPLIFAGGNLIRTGALLANTLLAVRTAGVALGGLFLPGAALLVGLGLLAKHFVDTRIEAVRAAVAAGALRAELLGLSETARRDRGIATALGIIEAEEALERAQDRLRELQAQATTERPSMGYADDAVPIGPSREMREAIGEVEELEDRLASLRQELTIINDVGRKAGEETARLNRILGDLGQGGEVALEGVKNAATILAQLDDALQVAAELGQLSDGFDENAVAVSALQSALRDLVALEGDHQEEIQAVAGALRERRAEMAEASEEAKRQSEEQAGAQRELNEQLAVFGQLIAATVTPEEEFAERQRILNELLAAGAISADQYAKALARARVELEETGKKGGQELSALQEFGIDAAAGLADAFADFATTSRAAFGDFVEGAMRDLARLIARFLVFKALSAAIPGFGGVFGAAFGFRAAGGPVSSGRPYIVGERGPELFVPAASGSIVSNSRLAAAGGPSAGDVAAEVLSRVGPPPGPTSPEAAARDRWYRSLMAEMVSVGRHDGLDI